MQFDRSLGDKYTVAVHKDPEGNTIEFTIKSQDTSGEELNAHIKKFAQENGIDELDSNSMQLVTEEILVMVLLPKLLAGTSMQYFISYNRNQGIIQMGMGYPGEKYNPFDEEDNIFMINIFREWVSDIKFKNRDNRFNELILMIQSANQSPSQLANQEEGIEIPDLEDYEDDYTDECEDACEDDLGEGTADIKKYSTKVLELVFREKNIDSKKLYAEIDHIFAKLPIRNKSIILDEKHTNEAESAIKAVSKVLIFDILKHMSSHFSYLTFKISYTEQDEEVMLRLRYPGNEYNPLLKNAEGDGIKIINRQEAITTFYSYRNDINEMIAVLTLVK